MNLKPAPLHIVGVLPGLSAGGAERVATMLFNRWVGMGHRVTLVTLDRGGANSYYALDHRITLVQLGLPTVLRHRLVESLFVVRRVVRLRRQLAALSPDVVLAFLTRTNIVAAAAAAGTWPVIVSERNNPRLQRVSRLWHGLRAYFYRRADGLVTITDSALQALADARPRRAWVIPNPVAPPSLPVTDTRGQQGRAMLVAAGRLVPQKGFDLLLDAFARVAPRHPAWQLTIWGEGPERAALEEQRDRLGLHDRVFLPGISREPGSWLHDASAFVLSSRFEGWGNVLAEAMVAGVPSVAFDCPWGPAEMINDGSNGLLVPAGDVPALADSLERLMNNAALRERLGAAGRRSMERFSLQQVGSMWDEAIEEVLQGRPGPARAGFRFADTSQIR